MFPVTFEKLQDEKHRLLQNLHKLNGLYCSGGHDYLLDQIMSVEEAIADLTEAMDGMRAAQ